MLKADAPVHEIAIKSGNNIITLDEAEVARWKKAAQPGIERWKVDIADKGINDQAVIYQAKALIKKNMPAKRCC